MGKKPFSSKAKREQLRAKRLATSTSVSQSIPPASPSQQLSTNTTQPPVTLNSNISHRKMARERAPKPNLTNRYRLQLGSDSTTTKIQQRAQAHIPISKLELPRTTINEIRPYPDPKFSMPRRPQWNYDESVEQVDSREMAYLREWIQTVENDDANAFFEHNLETWRQLWRVLERSDVIVLVVDIRYPALHFVPDLYYYITKETDKGIVLALNKCDLVPVDVLTAWKRYFQQTYPKLSIALFSSFPDNKLSPSINNSELLSKRERRMARTKLAAWGADQLLEAIETLSLSKKKKGFLQEWRAQLERSDDDDDNMREKFQSQNKIYSSIINHIESDLEKEKGSKKAQKKKRRRAKAKARAKGVEDIMETTTVTTMTTTGDERDDDNEMDVINEIDSLKLDVDDAKIREDMVTIGFVGHPNAGKSSLINGIFGKKVVSTSRTPGHTKHLQTIFLCDSVRLCDCPGLVFPAKAPRELQILAGMYPISQVGEPYSTIKYLAERTPVIEILGLENEKKKVEEFELEDDYFDEGWSAWKICEAWAMKRGFRTARAARLDVFRAANSILRLALDGRLVLATVPEGYVKGEECGTGNEKILDVTMKNKEIVENSFKTGNESNGEEADNESEETGSDEDEDENNGSRNLFALLNEV